MGFFGAFSTIFRILLLFLGWFGSVSVLLVLASLVGDLHPGIAFPVVLSTQILFLFC